MTITLGIAFSQEQCDAIMLERRKNTFVYRDAKTIPHHFEDFSGLSFLLQNFKSTKRSRVIVGIPAQHTMMRDFTLDARLSDKEILHYLKSQSAQWFGHNQEDLCLDYEIQPSDNTEKQTINVVAAHRPMIYHLKNAFQIAKLKIDAVDINSLATARAHTHLASQPFLSTSNTHTVAVGLCLWGIA